MATTTTLTTLAEFERLLEADGPKRELVEGEVFEMTRPVLRHSMAQQAISFALATFLRANPLGIVGNELGFLVTRDPDTLLSPDLYFLSTEKARTADLANWIEGAPDIAIEIISPNERFGDIRRKVDIYLRAGAQQVWLVYPEACEAQVYLPDGSAKILGAKDALEAPALLPGFRLTLEDACRDSRPQPPLPAQ
jgi:Uma2 family endonuclease